MTTTSGNKKNDWGKTQFQITNPDHQPFTITVSGRMRWGLEALKAAGPKGCTPIDHPGPRWSAYTFSLRELGVKIETITEKHGGAFSGDHARYILHSTVTRLASAGAAQ